MNLASMKSAGAQKAFLVEVLSTDYGYQPDRSGRTPYDTLCTEIRAITSADGPATLLEVLTGIAKDNRSQATEWWLRLLNLFTEVRRLSPEDRDHLIESYSSWYPESQEARAYYLRTLSYLGCDIEAISIPEMCKPSALASRYPLFIADALVLSEKFTTASQIVRKALAEKTIQSGNVKRMLDRWKMRAGIPAAKAFVTNMESVIENRQVSFEIISVDAKKHLSAGSRYYEKYQERMYA